MDWTLHADGEIAGAIQRLRDDQHAQVQASEEAARAIEICRQRIADDAEEIERLQAGL